MQKWYRAAIRPTVLGAALAGVAISAAVTPAAAFEADPTERERLRACERSLCEIILKKETTGDTLSCALQKTWVNDEISGGFSDKGLDWAFGDARCSVDLELPQQTIVASLTEGNHTLEMPAHPVRCELDNGGDITPVTFDLAPKIDFENGAATSATLNISNVEGDSFMATVIGGVAQLEEWTGLFKGEIGSEVNEFIGQKCAKRYPDLAAQ